MPFLQQLSFRGSIARRTLCKKLLYPAIACFVSVAGCTHAHHPPSKTPENASSASQTSLPSSSILININDAPSQDLERLPGIGKSLAARIIEHRERHGRFRRVEHLILIRGISERRFRDLRPYIKVER
ncbi:MAG: helix-hairpin-helix domain-containing protein [Pyrinomonadaceae bacterium MAG19_C2-C3]|nr:helix-hairpin-helix domain-containing protein [Pyrinomonadaceae bacterium MAG19_C2-C3]